MTGESDKLALGFSVAEESSEGKLPKARNDVHITEQVYYGKPCYVLKDPTTLRYYRLRPPEYTIFQMLDGKVMMEDVLRRLAERFPEEEYDAQAVMNFIVMLRGASLLRVPGDTDTDYLLKRKGMQQRSIFKKIRTEFLFFRLPLVDPDKLLNRLHDWLGKIIYTRTVAVMTLIMLAGALWLLISNFDKLGQAQPILSWVNLLYLGPALLLIKGIHEFGHGLTAKHFGTEVHEMGILFLVFTPCFYCDVSDAWMVNEKSKRMWITAAGIAVEIVLAGLATYIWALTEPKTVINQFALNMMIAASVNTLLFNGNPLLRYDGYYFLMDWMEIPNLRQKGASYLWYLFQRYVLGVETATEPIDVAGREPAVLGYAICSTIYRWFIMFAITAMVWRFLDPYGWGALGGIMALGCIYTSFIVPIGKFFKFLYTSRHRLHIRIVTAGILLLLIGGTVWGFLAWPVEQSITTQCVLRPQSMHLLYVTQPGFILEDPCHPFVRDGQWVQEGQVLLTLQDEQLSNQAEDLRLQIEQINVQIRQAEQRPGAEAESEVVQLEAQKRGLQARYDRAVQNLEKLVIRAPVAGIVELRTTEPLEHLVGSFLPLQSALFAVYEGGAFEAVAAINHRDYGQIEPGQRVEIKLWSFDDLVLTSEVITKPPTPVWRLSSPAFSTVFGGEVATMPAASSSEAVEPAENTYELVLPVQGLAEGEDDSEVVLGLLRHEMEGRAKIIVQERTLGGAFYRWLLRTMRQDLRL
ncbi:MAG: hypothetical protein JW936_10275 [Sedimentisphaerales bacterium]|nr:hypothetical protein [Sedimentisphaerales bacterium]